ncbi:TPM domain-containing protein [Azomonas macrocytogenes]|uniref:Putative membrane protein n=1 Tax=Azomonas macrocytogenes TaxID=69962 RepID=A0A839T5G5_AZOMA|nr:TPM domain-containing protein [Azomonas macrocytogenes]MBB3104020.1 putative membrane protein [Azomonas macrocytogenes]
MTLLSESEQQQVAAAIKRIERDTDAELVTVLAARADDYTYISLLWAGMLALLGPGVINYYPLWLNAHELLLTQWLTFIVLSLLFKVPAITTRLVPQRVRHWHAANLARRQFLELKLHHTEGGTGMLIFVSEAERYVEILVDHGISSQLSDETWAAIVSDFTMAVRRGETLQGFLTCIAACGEVLRQHVPVTRLRNELPDHLVILT